MATVHVGTNTDPHRTSFSRAPPEGRLLPAERRQTFTTPSVLTHRTGRIRVAVTPTVTRFALALSRTLRPATSAATVERTS